MNYADELKRLVADRIHPSGCKCPDRDGSCDWCQSYRFDEPDFGVVPCSTCGTPMEDRGAEKQWCADCARAGAGGMES